MTNSRHGDCREPVRLPSVMSMATHALRLDETHDARLSGYLVMSARMLVNRQAADGSGGADHGLTPA